MKRVIALPGDTVRIRRMEAFVRPKGTPDFVSEFSLSFTRYDIHKDPLPEGWVETDPLGGGMDELVLKEDEYFLMGDNRSVSTDSRLMGPVSKNRLYAKVLVRYWPFGKLKKP
jgi:signal peptidase I